MAGLLANNPGVCITYRDGDLVILPLTNQTGNVTLIDYALWGPVNQPVNVGTIDAVKAKFGNTTGAYGEINRLTGYNGNTLSYAAGQVLGAQNQNLTLVRPDFGGIQAATELFFAIEQSVALQVTGAGTATNGAVLNLAGTVTNATKRTGLMAALQVGHACWNMSNPNQIYQVAGINNTTGSWSVILAGNAVPVPIDLGTPATVTVGTSNAALTLTAGTNYLGTAANGVLGVQILAAGSSATPTVAFASNTLIVTLGSTGTNNTATLIAAAINTSVACTNNISAVAGGNGSGTVLTAGVTTCTGGIMGSSTWTFAAGFSIAGAYPGAVGNTIKYKTDLSGTGPSNYTLNLRVQTPVEFGGKGFVYNSLYYSTLGTLIAKFNSDLADIATCTLTYATGSESVGYTGIINAVINNTSSGSETAAQQVADITNPSDATWYLIGMLPTLSGTLVNAAVTVGSDAAVTTQGLPMNPNAASTSADLRHQWYANVLGTVLNTATNNTATLPLMLGQPFGVLVVPGLFFDDMLDPVTGAVQQLDANGNVAAISGGMGVAYANALQYLLEFCHQQNIDGLATSVVMGCSPLRSTTLSAIAARAAFLQSAEFMSDGFTNHDGTSPLCDIGRYLSVVAGPQLIISDPQFGTYASSGALQYAALRTTLTAGVPPSQKPLNGNAGASFGFTRRQLSNLSGGQGPTSSGGAYVVFDTIGAQPIVNLAVTAAGRNSDYAKTHNWDVVQVAGAAVRGAVSPFLGSAFGVEQYNGMYTAIQSALDALVDQNVISGGLGVGYNFQITQTTSDAVLGQANVSLSIRPNFELDWVNVDIKLTV